MKKTLLVISLFISTLSQAQFMTDVNGRPVKELIYTDIDGSPYLRDEWSVGLIRTKSGKSQQLARVRYDAYQDELEYDQAGKYFRLASEISEFSCIDGTFRNGYSEIDNHTKNSFYQVLYDGKTKVLKKIAVRVIAEKPYGSATDVKRFLKEETLYLAINGELKAIKKDKKAILLVLIDKKDQLETFIKDQKLKLSNEDDILKVVEKYDTL